MMGLSRIVCDPKLPPRPTISSNENSDEYCRDRSPRRSCGIRWIPAERMSPEEVNDDDEAERGLGEKGSSTPRNCVPDVEKSSISAAIGAVGSSCAGGCLNALFRRRSPNWLRPRFNA